MTSSNLDELREEYTPDELEAALKALKGKLFIPHEGGQREVLDASGRFKVVAAGRRWGKTKAAAREVVRAARQGDSMNWWVANTYRNVRRGYREVVRQTPRELLAKEPPVSTSNELILQYKTGALVEFYSAGNADALAGEGLDFLVVDEAGLILDSVWYQLLRPTLMDKKGRAFIISTPRGRNWFYKLFMKGQAREKGYESWRFPQTANPTIDPEETENAKLEMPEIFYRQEILAEFLASGASIFGRGVEHIGTVIKGLADPRGDVFVGIDLAKQADFTVISAARGEDAVPVYLERFTDVSWPVQRKRIHAAVEYLENYPGVTSVTVLVDVTGVGDVVYDDLMDEGLYCIPIPFSNAWKDKAVKLLAADMEQGRGHITEEQLEEFESYAFTITDSGKFKYEASVGHDDYVSAKLLEHWGLHFEGPPAIQALMELEEEPENESILPPQEEWTELPSAQEIMEQPGAWAGFEGNGLRPFS